MPREHTTNDPIYRANRKTLLSDNPPCYRCGKPADTADHIIEYDRGGSDDLDNLRPACRRCNSQTGAIYKAKRDALRIQKRNAAINHFLDRSSPPLPSFSPFRWAGVSLCKIGEQ